MLSLCFRHKPHLTCKLYLNPLISLFPGAESPFRQSRSNSTHNTGGQHSTTTSQRSSRTNSRRGSDPQAMNRQIQTPVLDRIGNFFNRLTSSGSAYDAIPEPGSLPTGITSHHHIHICISHLAVLPCRY